MAESKKFGGTDGVSFQSFLRDFNVVFAINKFMLADKATILAAYLEGAALHFYKSIFNEELTFEQVCSLLEEEFPSHGDDLELFYSAYQAKEENLVTYWYRLCNLASKAKVTDDKKIISRFLKSMSPRFRNILAARVYSDKKELRDALLQLSEVQPDVQGDRTQNLPTNPPQGYNRQVGFHNRYGNRGDTTSYDARQAPSSSSPRDEGDNFRTPRYNLRPRNIANTNVFPSNPNSSGSNRRDTPTSSRQFFRPRERNVMSMEHIESASADQLHNESNLSGQLSPFIKVTINNSDIEALLDTGATVNAMSKALARSLNLQIRPSTSLTHIRSITGSSATICGEVNVNMILANILVRVNFIVLNNIELDLVLGQSFMFANAVSIDFRKNCLWIKGFKVNWTRRYDDKTVSKASRCTSLNIINTNNMLFNYKAINETIDYYPKRSFNNEIFKSEESKQLIDGGIPANKRSRLVQAVQDCENGVTSDNGSTGGCGLSDDIPVHTAPYRSVTERSDLVKDPIQDVDFDVAHRSGKSNIVADYPSRYPLKIEDDDTNTPVSDGIEMYNISTDTMVVKQCADLFCRSLRNGLTNNDATNYKGFLLKKNVVLPRELLKATLEDLHDHPWSGGHFGIAKTLSRFRNGFFVPKAVNMVSFAYNATKHTGMSPHMLLFAREPILQSNFEVNQESTNESYASRHARANYLVQRAKVNIRNAQRRQKAYYDKKVKFVVYRPGQLVLIYSPRRISGRSKKLCKPYKGPFIIIRRISNTNYVVGKMNNSSWQDIVHTNFLKPFVNRRCVI